MENVQQKSWESRVPQVNFLETHNDLQLRRTLMFDFSNWKMGNVCDFLKSYWNFISKNIIQAQATGISDVYKAIQQNIKGTKNSSTPYF